MKLFLICLALIGLAIAGIAIKMFVKKNGEFERKCAHIEFENGERVGCARCMKEDGTYGECQGEKGEDELAVKYPHFNEFLKQQLEDFKKSQADGNPDIQ